MDASGQFQDFIKVSHRVGVKLATRKTPPTAENRISEAQNIASHFPDWLFFNIILDKRRFLCHLFFVALKFRQNSKTKNRLRAAEMTFLRRTTKLILLDYKRNKEIQ
jgi:hypothetical protein